MADPVIDSPDRGVARRRALEAASPSLHRFLGEDSRASVVLDGEIPSERGELTRRLREVSAEGGLAELRLEKRRWLLAIAARDLAGELDLEGVGAHLSDLADACLQVALETVDPGRTLGVVAMGKLGARELNYVSDIDVMFVTAAETGEATRAAERLLSELGGFTPQGTAYFIDANLRPEGRSGALVRSLDGYLEYYRKWSKPWEHQALIKARPAAGDTDVASRLVEETRALVFTSEVSPERVASIRAIKERVEGHAARSARRAKASEEDDVKLGPGGIRDIEFSVQLLQLVHGATDETVRDAATLQALRALVDGGYVADDDGAGLAVAYKWLRTVEHRVQLRQERRLHRLPAAEQERSLLARSLGFRDTPAASARDVFEARHRAVLADVRARFEKLFYRPMIETLAGGTSSARLSERALEERLHILGFRDVARAAQTLHGLVVGTTRRAKLVRVIAPAMLRHLAVTPLPDVGLFAFLRLAEALTHRADVLGALRDNPATLDTLARSLGSGRVVGDVLMHLPEEVGELALVETKPPKPREQLLHEARASLGWRDPTQRMAGLRRFKRRELLGIAIPDVAGSLDVQQVGASLSDLADACLQAVVDDASVPIAVVGMGKLGGRELSYASDIDVILVHGGDRDEALRFAESMLRAVGDVTPEGQAFNVDLGLRPEGKSGPLIRSLDSYREYYERWARPWELQAALKGRFVAGDESLGNALLEVLRARLAEEPFADKEVIGEIRHLKARMERERIPRGQDARRNLKLGPGGLSDIEFAAQILQLLAPGEKPVLGRATVDALRDAESAGTLDSNDTNVLVDAYRFALRLRNRLFLMTGRPVDALATRPEEVEAAGIAMGFVDQPRQELEEHYLRHTRRARKIAARVIYGE